MHGNAQIKRHAVSMPCEYQKNLKRMWPGECGVQVTDIASAMENKNTHGNSHFFLLQFS
jgi:hypothetical protein